MILCKRFISSSEFPIAFSIPACESCSIFPAHSATSACKFHNNFLMYSFQ
ncbi:unnamed protein product [Periconia digitata]|uniref:Uncharacterized protein n=1 Tax=Periconia digitata TaxID=1303443 RepID=A0A9W4U623_9PLEO|nr:unnamed protein product [Periconia digitata]